MILYAATTNAGKLREFAESARDEAIEVLALPGLDRMPEPVEDASTFLGNAELKARAYSLLAPGLLVFADDSGLEVDALGGQPGVRSARFADDLGFAGETVTTEAADPTDPTDPIDRTDPAPPQRRLGRDERNNQCVLSLLRHAAAANDANISRHARFRCVLALARDGEVLLHATGHVEGELLKTPRGSNGFGYDPLFFLPAFGKTMAELSRAEKTQISHRGLAFRALLRQLRSTPSIS